MHAINASKAPTLWQRIDMAEREAANRLFSAEFPRIEHVRQTAAHPGELSKSAVEAAKHRLREAVHNERIQVAEDSGIFIQSMVHAAEDHMIYSSTFKGQLVEYELSTRKANALAAVVGHYRRAFYPAEDPQWAQMRKMIEASQRSRRT
jgi:inosine/xanthosine triphosphate pyrophosphatase family protein